MADEKSLQDYHHDGQIDGGNNTYDEPHNPDGFFNFIWGWTEDEKQEQRDENEAYKSGWENGWNNR
jgi:hypothetical protein